MARKASNGSDQLTEDQLHNWKLLEDFPRRLQEEVCGQEVKLSSFSEMQHLCDPDLLAGLLRELNAQALPIFGDARVRAQVEDLIANDGTPTSGRSPEFLAMANAICQTTPVASAVNRIAAPV